MSPEIAEIISKKRAHRKPVERFLNVKGHFVHPFFDGKGKKNPRVGFPHRGQGF
jgi:hypothetical protein